VPASVGVAGEFGQQAGLADSGGAENFYGAGSALGELVERVV
jgi:hypothetical protein